MIRGLTGTYTSSRESGEEVRAFRPSDLPPAPPIDWTGDRQRRLERATLALGRLDAVSTLLPGHDAVPLRLRPHARPCSRRRSRAPSRRCPTCCCSSSTWRPACPSTTSWRCRTTSPPWSTAWPGCARASRCRNRLIREMHGLLLASGRGSRKEPGEFRRTQNWIGGTRPGNAAFVPPPPADVGACMGALERFLHAPDPGVPELVARGARPRPVRDHPPVPRRQRPRRPAADPAHARARRHAAAAAALPEPLLQASTGTSTTGCSGRSGPTATGRRGSTSSSRASSRPPAVRLRRRTGFWS